jgi:hypothetical protein
MLSDEIIGELYVVISFVTFTLLFNETYNYPNV